MRSRITAEHFDVFLSHNSKDKPQVEWLAQQLANRGLRAFLDKWDLQAGNAWRTDLESALANSKTAVVFFGPYGVGPWHDAEIDVLLDQATTRRNDFRVTSILLPGAKLENVPLLLRRLGRLDFSQNWEHQTHVDELVGFVTGSPYRDSIGSISDDPAPYRGLERFEAEHSDFFFGRDREVRDLARRLVHGKFVAVIGPSGCGKSSLVRAGLRQAGVKEATGIESWTNITIVPGKEPFRALAEAIRRRADSCNVARAPVDAIEWTEKQIFRLRANANALRTTVTTLFGGATPVVLLIDQFEELFTHCREIRGGKSQDAQDVDAFIAAIVECVTEGDASIRVMITVRSDFLEHCLRYPALNDLLHNNVLLIGELSDDALREVIKFPAALRGAYLETGLVELLLNDFRSQVGSLPLLGYVLFQLWRSRKGRWMTLAAYNESNGLRGALSRHADQALARLPTAAHREVARQLFIYRLITPGDGVPDTRLRVLQSTLYPTDDSQRAIIDDVLLELSGKESRLLVFDRGDSTGSIDECPPEQIHVEITHEAILRGWTQLGDWLNDARAHLRQYRRLCEYATEWIKAGRPVMDDAYLLKGRILEDAELLETHEHVPINADEKAILSASRRFRETTNATTAARTRLHRRLLFGFGVAAVFTLCAVIYAMHVESVANAVVDEQQRLSQRVKFNVAVAKAALLRDIAPETANLILNDGSECPVQIREASWSYVLRSCNRILARASPHGQRINELCLDRKHRVLFGACDDHTISRSNLSNGRVSDTEILRAHKSNVWSLAVSPDSSTLVTVEKGGIACWWNTATGMRFNTLDSVDGSSREMNTVRFSLDGALIAIGIENGGVLIADAMNPTEHHKLLHDRESVNALAFLSDEQLLAADTEGMIHLWDLKTRSHLSKVRAHHGRVLTVDYSAVSNTIATTGSNDDRISLWRINGTEIQKDAELHEAGPPASAAVFNFDSAHLVSLHGRSVYVWDLGANKRILVVPATSGGAVDATCIALTELPYVYLIGNSDGSISTINLDPLNADKLRPTNDRNATALAISSVDTATDISVLYSDGVTWNCKRNGTIALRSTIPNATALSLIDQAVPVVGTGGGQLYRLPSGAPPVMVHDLHQNRIVTMEFIPRTMRLASLDTSGKVVIFNISSSKVEAAFLGSVARATALHVLPANGHIIVGDEKGEVSMWEKGRLLMSASFGSVPILKMASDKMGKVIAISNTEGRVWVAGTQRLQQQLNFMTGDGPIRALAHLPSGVLATGGSSSIQLWDIETGQMRLAIERLNGHVNAIVCFDNDKRMAVASGAEVMIFDTSIAER